MYAGNLNWSTNLKNSVKYFSEILWSCHCCFHQKLTSILFPKVSITLTPFSKFGLLIRDLSTLPKCSIVLMECCVEFNRWPENNFLTFTWTSSNFRYFLANLTWFFNHFTWCLCLQFLYTLRSELDALLCCSSKYCYTPEHDYFCTFATDANLPLFFFFANRWSKGFPYPYSCNVHIVFQLP